VLTCAGIGFETAKALLQRDYQVVLACRDKEKAEAARGKLK
jgi:NAD(P)-dependent dehydrogenase (short-subunit alcohol dehydrogenase family)